MSEGETPQRADYATWAERALPIAYNRALAIRNDPDLAHDVVRDVLRKAVEKRAGYFDCFAKFRAWVIVAVRHGVIQQLRRAARERPLDPDGPVPSGPASRGAVPLVWECLHRLPEEQRNLLLMYFYDGMTYPEIATFLGVGLATAWKRLQAARDRLGRILLEAGLNPVTWEVLPDPAPADRGRPLPDVGAERRGRRG